MAKKKKEEDESAINTIQSFYKKFDKVNKLLDEFINKNPFQKLGESMETFLKFTESFSEQGYADKYQKEHVAAQEKTKQFVGDLAAYGYMSSPDEVASLYLQFSDIEQRRFKSEQLVHMVTTRGTWGTGIAENLTGVNFTQGGEKGMEWVSDTYNKNFYLDPERQRERLEGIIKNGKNSQKEIYQNNKINED